MKKILIGVSLLVAAGLMLFTVLEPARLLSSKQQSNDRLIAEQLAYHYGVAAYLYGYPIVDMYRQRHNETHRVSAEQQVYAPLNRLYRFPDLVEPETAGNLRAPNSDTLYFSGWYDVSEEPLIIHTPDTAGRYFTIAVTNQYAEVVHIGRRATGTEQAYFALVPPHWQGQLPEGIRAVAVDTDSGWLLGRMLVAGRDDFDAAMALVNDVWLAGLGEFRIGRRPALPPDRQAGLSDPLDTLEFFDILNRELQTLPARPGEAALMAQFDAIGIGPNSRFDAASLDEARREGLLRAIEDASAVVEASAFRSIPAVNGWMMSLEIGRYGYDFLHRASVVRGGYGNLPEESVYPATVFDQDGKLLTGSRAYELRFAAGQLPPVNGFWSLAAYTIDGRLEPNAIARYSIGDRSPGLQFKPDGSLTIRIQHNRPEGDEGNWLPAPAGSFFLVMRLYEPSDAVLTGQYQLPAVTMNAE